MMKPWELFPSLVIQALALLASCGRLCPTLSPHSRAMLFSCTIFTNQFLARHVNQRMVWYMKSDSLNPEMKPHGLGNDRVSGLS